MSYLIFTDQKAFMHYSGQKASPETAALYRKLVAEEDKELNDALAAYDADPTPENLTEIADGIIDGLYVRIGLLHGFGLDPQALWDEVQRSNIAKMKHPCYVCAQSDTPGKIIDGDSTEEIVCPKCRGETFIYEVRKREDGKTLKPEGWKPPNLLPLVIAALAKHEAEQA